MASRIGLSKEARDTFDKVTELIAKTQCETTADYVRLLRALRDDVTKRLDATVDQSVNMED